MPKSRRRSHKRLKTVPIQNCQIQTTPIRAISSPPELLLVRRSQRLREKTKPAATVVSDFERDVLRRLHRRAFNVAAAVDSICGSSSSGNNMNNNSNENKRQSQINNNNSGINRNLLPCDAWVYRTPEKQRLPRPGRPLPTKQVPMGLARIHTIRRRMLEGGCVIEEAEDTVVISPIVDDVAGGGGDNFFTGSPQIWRPFTVGHRISPTAFQNNKRSHDDDDQFPPTHRPFRAPMDQVSGHSSIFAAPTMRNLFPFLQPGVSPFPNN